MFSITTESSQRHVGPFSEARVVQVRQKARRKQADSASVTTATYVGWSRVSTHPSTRFS